MGIDWTTDERYVSYQHQHLEEKKARRQSKRKEKQAEFLKGPEVTAYWSIVKNRGCGGKSWSLLIQ